MHDKNTIVSHPDQLLQDALAKFSATLFDEGLSLLEDGLKKYPEHRGIAGNLAWIYLSTGKHDKAIELYENLKKSWKENNEIEFRLLQAKMLKGDNPDKIIKKMVKAISKPPQRRELWSELIKIDKDQNNARNNYRIVKAAASLFPDDSEFLLNSMESGRVKRQKMLREIAKIFQLHKIFNLLLKSSIFRKLLRESTDSTVDYLYSAMQDYYLTGSTNICFVKSPPEFLPENFDKHFLQCKCSWFKWTIDKLKDYEHKKKNLIDIGCGTGCLGHHFQKLGYKVTALSGNMEELAECSRRGMEILETDMHKTGLPSASFDAALASNVLEHSIAPLILLWEIRRILKPEGILHVHLPYPIDGNLALDFPETYNKEKDSYIFELDENNYAKNHVFTQYTHGGVAQHLFVLTYWQWRWIFKNAGFEHIDSVLELPDTKLIHPADTKKKEYEKIIPLQMIFLLRKKCDK